MIRGTTPTITFKFSQVNAADITSIFLTVENESGDQILGKNIEDATIDTEANSIAWDLSQEQTLAMQKKVCIQVRYKVGTKAYASRVYTVSVTDILKEGII